MKTIEEVQKEFLDYVLENSKQVATENMSIISLPLPSLKDSFLITMLNNEDSKQLSRMIISRSEESGINILTNEKEIVKKLKAIIKDEVK